MASSQIETVTTSADKAKLAAAAVLAVAGIAVFFLLTPRAVALAEKYDSPVLGSVVPWGGMLVVLALAVAVFLTTGSGQRLMAFGRDAWREVKKVVWPARKETMQMTAYVFAFVVVMSIFLWLADKTLEWVFFDLILGWRK
jgi:preprotein translocase subunit SecE